MGKTWKLEGFISFERRIYSLKGEYPSEGEARREVIRQIEEVRLQSSSSESVLKYRATLVRPNGTKHTYSNNKGG